MKRHARFVLAMDDDRLLDELRTIQPQVEGMQIVAEMAWTACVEPVIAQLPFDVLLIDLDPDPKASLKLIQEVLRVLPDTVVMTASRSTDGLFILEAVRAGVLDYLLRPIEPATLDEALRRLELEARIGWFDLEPA